MLLLGSLSRKDGKLLHQTRKGTARMRRLPWIALGLAIIALVLVAIPLQSRLRVLQHELGTTNRQLVQARAASAELERVNAKLKTELDAVSKARTQLQGHLDEANTKAEQLGKDLNTAQSQLKEKEAHEKELTTELEKTKKEAYAQLAAAKEANQRQFETITNEATQKLSESEKRVADLTDQLKSMSAERDALQSKLSENQSEFEALENELAKAKEATQEASAKASELENAANQSKDAEAERTQIQLALDQANKEIERLQSELEQQKMTPPVSVSPSPEEASPPPGQ
jgi:chromosome segregation ATPase